MIHSSLGASVWSKPHSLGSASVLFDAAASGNPDIISLLLEYGADPNVPTHTGHLPIHRAAYRGHLLWVPPWWWVNRCSVYPEKTLSFIECWSSWSLWLRKRWSKRAAWARYTPPLQAVTLSVWICSWAPGLTQTSCYTPECAGTMRTNAGQRCSSLCRITTSSQQGCFWRPGPCPIKTLSTACRWPCDWATTS